MFKQKTTHYFRLVLLLILINLLQNRICQQKWSPDLLLVLKTIRTRCSIGCMLLPKHNCAEFFRILCNTVTNC